MRRRRLGLVCAAAAVASEPDVGARLRASAAASDGQTISVVDLHSHRLLLRGRVTLGAEYCCAAAWARDQPVFSGMAVMSALAFLASAPRRALCLGLGAGTVPEFLRARGIDTTVVEHEAAVVDLATAHFAFGERPAPGRTIVADAFAYIANTTAATADPGHDVLLSDLFDGQTSAAAHAPAHFANLKRWLRPHGTLVLNLVAYSAGPYGAPVLGAAIAALRDHFAHVRAFSDHAPDAARDASVPHNVVVFASDAADGVRFRPPAGGDAAAGTADHVYAHFESWEIPLDPAGSRLGGDGGGASAAPSGAASGTEDALDAIAGAMAEEQRRILPDGAWAAVAAQLAADDGNARDEL